MLCRVWSRNIKNRCSIYIYDISSLRVKCSLYNEDVLLKEQRNILHEIRKRKANWIGQILRRNCLLQWVIEGKIKGGMEVTGRRGRRCRKLLDDLKERRGYSHLKEEALDHTMWRACFGRGFGPVVRQTTRMNEQWLGAGWMDERLILGGGKRFSVHHVCPDWPWGLPDLLYNGHRGSTKGKALRVWQWTSAAI